MINISLQVKIFFYLKFSSLYLIIIIFQASFGFHEYNFPCFFMIHYNYTYDYSGCVQCQSKEISSAMVGFLSYWLFNMRLLTGQQNCIVASLWYISCNFFHDNRFNIRSRHIRFDGLELEGGGVSYHMEKESNHMIGKNKSCR